MSIADSGNLKKIIESLSNFKELIIIKKSKLPNLTVILKSEKDLF